MKKVYIRSKKLIVFDPILKNYDGILLLRFVNC